MKINTRIPQTWNELTTRQLLRVGKLLNSESRMNKRLFIGLLISILALPKFSIKGYIKLLILFWDVPLSELEQYTDFIVKRTNYLTKFPTKFKIKGKWIYGPSNRMANITVAEFAKADEFFYKWATTKKQVYLDSLVTVLYRYADFKQVHDPRVPFNKLALSKYADFAQKIPQGYKIVIALAYEGCREIVYKKYPDVFLISKTKSDSNQPSKYESFSKVINAMSMSEVQVLGTLQETESVDVNTFLTVFTEQIKRNRELQNK